MRDLLNEKSQLIHELVSRYSKPEEFAQLLQSDILEPETHKIASNSPLSFEAHSIMVREIWIGYFPQNYNEDVIQRVLSKYVKVERENIDLKRKNQNFAFIRLQTATDAYFCIQNLEQISQDFGLGHRIKISYSDYLKRNLIVADDVFCKENQKNLTNVVFVSFQLGLPLPLTCKIHKYFSKVGTVLNIIMRPSANVNEVLKSYFLVEMENLEQAIKARKYFYLED